jgi:hypothetical protein
MSKSATRGRSLHTAKRVALILCLSIGVVASLSASVATRAASAAVTPQPYLDPAYADELWDDVVGWEWPDTFPAAWAESGFADAAVAAGGITAPEVVGPIVLSTVAVGLSVKFHRSAVNGVVDLFAHFAMPNSGTSTTTTYLVNEGWWPSYADGTQWWQGQSPSHTASIWGPADHTPRQMWIMSYKRSDLPNLWIQRMWPCTAVGQLMPIPGTGSYYTCQGVDVDVWSWLGSPNQGNYQGIVVHDDFYSSACPGPTGCGTYVRVATRGELKAQWDQVHLYHGESVDQTINIAAPTRTPALDGAIQGAIGDGGPALENEVNSVLDPDDWQRPDDQGAGGGAIILWPSANRPETYDDYLARLRNAGWVGSATTVELDDDLGDPAYGSQGVPCTSVIPGVRIFINQGVTFFRNPVGYSAGSGGGWEGGCGGGDSTPPPEEKCKFLQSLGRDWKTVRLNNPSFYDAACAQAWAMLRDAAVGILDANGYLTQEAIDTAHRVGNLFGSNLHNPKVISTLTSRSPITNWEKATTDVLGTPRFQLHFYRQFTASPMYADETIDFYVVFVDFFEP